MNETRQNLFAGPGLAGDQHGGVAFCYAAGQVQQLDTGRLDGNRPVALGRLQTSQCMPRNQRDQCFGLERFDQVIRSPLAHGIDRALDRAMCGHQQHRQLRMPAAQQTQQLVTVHARHVDVTDHQTEWLRISGHQRLFGGTDRLIAITGQLKGFPKRFPERTVILDQQHIDRHQLLPVELQAGINGRLIMAQVPRPTLDK